MTLQLQDLTLVSMQDFTNLIAQPQVRTAQLGGRAFYSGFPILSERKAAQDSFPNETAASISSDPVQARAERLGQLAQSGWGHSAEGLGKSPGEDCVVKA